MGRPKKKIEAELLDPEEEMPETTKPITRLVDAEHTIKYREPVPVPIQESESDEESSMIWDDDDEKKPKKLHKSVREKIQDRLGKAKVTGGDQVFLRIDRMPNYDSGSTDGMGGDKEFCWRGPCTVEYITNDDYLADTAKRHGAGVYWYTLRHGKVIVASWMHKIGGSPQVATQVADTMTGQPHIIYQPIPQTNGQVIPQSVPVTKTLKEVADIIEVVDRIRGNHEPTRQIIEQVQQPVLSDEERLATIVMKDKDVARTVISNLIGSVDTKERAPTVTELLFKYGEGLGKVLFGGLVDVIKTASSEIKQIKMIDLRAMQQQVNGENHHTHSPILNTAEPIDNNEHQSLDPKDILMSIALTGCQHNSPVKVIVNQLIAFADRIEDEAPHMSVYGWLDLFTEQTTEQIMALLQSGMLGEHGVSVSTLAHAPQWIDELRTLLKTDEGDKSE
jgi:hypothetical protein